MSFVPTVSPAPPADLPGLVAAYEQTSRSVLVLGRSCPPERAGDPTPCPGWDVFAQVAHVESVEATLLGEPVAEVEVGERPHVRSDMGRFMEQLVESRRGLSLPDLCDRLERVIERRVEQWSDPRLTAETVVPGPFGAAPVAEVVGIRCFDIWTHEQDLRETLGHPGGLHSPAAALSLTRSYAALGRVVVRAGVPVGESVVIEVRGPVSGRQAVRVAEVDGKPRGELVEDVTDHDAHCVLVLGTREMGRLAAGRMPIREREFAWTAVGDQDAAAALVRHLSVTP